MRRRRWAWSIAWAWAGGSLALAACAIDVVGELVTTRDADVPVEASLPGVIDGGVDAAIDARTPVCPATGRGPTMVRVDADGAGPFCIDATEVTNGHYDAFLAATAGGRVDAGEPEGGLPDACAPVTRFARKGNADSGADPAQPVARVTWCDAYAFCAWSGKRLCGGIVDRDASTGEWHAACAGPTGRPYPYGDAFADASCNSGRPGGETHPVGARPACAAPSGLVDMSGNVAEWVDTCDAFDRCAAVGGYFESAPADVTCRSSAFYYRTTETYPAVGFRCCADPR